ncbi:MAG: NAD(+) synthase [Alphaproteobacteria bacterium]|nr:NAD(+) synthase [Alphaproteobacteria bacterium]
MEKIWKALVVGMRDYCEQNGFKQVCLGLSGGLDSAVCSIIAKEALGADNVYAYMMKTKYTSMLSLQIAQEIAKRNKIHYQVIDIQPEVEYYERKFAQVFAETPKDLVMQNVQSRIRGQILMALSNQFGYLVLACGNKSEAAMGYCTLYGDTCGGLMPIGDLYKTQIFALAKWLNGHYASVLPEAVISRAPSAELKAGQKDEDSLPVYDVLDEILMLLIDKNLSVKEIVARGHSNSVVGLIEKTYRKMFFKRQQMPSMVKCHKTP